jgi:hypothetical protein
VPRLRLEAANGDAFDLDGIAGSGLGIAALEGATGFGLPPVSTQWIEGAGDGAQYRGGRVLARDLDLPIYVQAPTRADLKVMMARASTMLAGPMVLRFVEDDGSSWTLNVRRVGGGQLTLGRDVRAENWLTTVVTLRAGDPFWTSSAVTRREIVASAGRGLLEGTVSLSMLRVSPSQTLGSITMENTGDADAYPVWTITGPGSNLVCTSATGESFAWNGTLTAGQTLTIDTRAASVVDGTGTNRYADLGPAPQLWRIPPGTTTASVILTGSTAASKIAAEWRPRKWAVI